MRNKINFKKNNDFAFTADVCVLTLYTLLSFPGPLIPVYWKQLEPGIFDFINLSLKGLMIKEEEKWRSS